MKNGFNSDIIVGIDIGSNNIFCSVGVVDNNKKNIKLLGLGTAPVMDSFKKGAIANRNNLIEQLEIAITKAEDMAGTKIDNAYMTITGDHIRCMNTQGAIALNRNKKNGTNSNEPISQKDIKRVLELTQGIALPPDRDILHTIPQEFIVDTLEKIDNPIGLSGRRLEGHVHLVTASTSGMKNLVESAEELGININGLVFKPLASAMPTLTKDEIKLGVSLIDIGATTTSIAVFKDGAVRHSAVIPVGSSSITNDIAVMLRISIEEAEEIKIKYASAKSSLSSQKLEFEIPSVEEKQMISENELSQYVEARMEEIFQLSLNEIKRADIDNNLTYGTVLTGGGAQLRNIVTLANDLLKMPVRLGKPINYLIGNKDFADDPVHSTTLGLLLWPLYSNEQKHIQQTSFTFLDNLKNIFKEFF